MNIIVGFFISEFSSIFVPGKVTGCGEGVLLGRGISVLCRPAGPRRRLIGSSGWREGLGDPGEARRTSARRRGRMMGPLESCLINFCWVLKGGMI